MNAAGYADAVIQAIDAQDGEGLARLFTLSALSPRIITTPTDQVILQLRDQRVSIFIRQKTFPMTLPCPLLFLSAATHPVSSCQMSALSHYSMDGHIDAADCHCTATGPHSPHQSSQSHSSYPYTRLWPRFSSRRHRQDNT